MSKYALQNGDCLVAMKKIPNESIDLVLTDPPYNIAKDNNFDTMGRSSIDFGTWDHDADILTWISDAARTLKRGGTLIVFNDWKNLGDIAKELEKSGLIVKDLIRWEKTNPMPRNRDRRYIVDYEFAIVAIKKGKWTFNRQSDKYDRSELRYPIVSGKNKFHPTQKPVELMEELILRHSNENDIVLDCFMGSGSTGIAALNLKRRFIGIELNEEYFDVAKTRIENKFDIKKEKSQCKTLSK
ncbi:DNA-methyltransferase [Liquorilactobacillus mali]|uniref:Methyltransferase n=1 Tax=Liquorilactobacillus mali KCTC 3596 = DSM 20444 TaxID=1046596 RepID=A0A0R2E6C5_9LACO|nr:site-specific DNA-methyltransferase [Liquorilactobacillus mali]KRN10859.1 DNA methylase [Liquorilactobacillus mali KCTC 3596 = DSM 20444]